MPKPTIVCDFDGVIHQYTTPWTTADCISDPPVPGAFAWLGEMVKDFTVVICSSRITPEPLGDGSLDWATANWAAECMLTWFRRHGLPSIVLEQIRLWQDFGKPKGLIYIDDRGFRFEGIFPSRQWIQSMRPWNRRDSVSETLLILLDDAQAFGLELDKPADRIVAGILADLVDRRGFSGVWDGIDPDIRCEIVAAWRNLARNLL